MTKHADDSATQHEAMVRQNLLGRLIFASRWLQLPIYLGLIVVQAIYSYKFLNSYKHIHQSGLSYFVCTYRSELECAEVLFLPYSFLIFDVAKIRQFLNSKKY